MLVQKEYNTVVQLVAQYCPRAPSCAFTRMNSCRHAHARMHACILTYIRTCMHACTRAYMHTHIHVISSGSRTPRTRRWSGKRRTTMTTKISGSGPCCSCAYMRCMNLLYISYEYSKIHAFVFASFYFILLYVSIMYVYVRMCVAYMRVRIVT